ncbi:MAG: DnaA/Hda family protein [Pseudomonadota bacterium]
MADQRQLAFDMPSPPSYATEDFVTGEGNKIARDLAVQLAWPIPVGLVIGERAAGKSHLAHMMADRFDHAVWLKQGVPNDLDARSILIIDGLETCMDDGGDAVFHALEAARAAQAPVFVTSREPPEALAFRKPDALSRLRAGRRAEIQPPDDALLAAIAVKLFTDRQLLVEADIAHYLLRRVERSYGQLADLIAQIDKRALEAGRSITKPLAGQVLADFEAGQDNADRHD